MCTVYAVVVHPSIRGTVCLSQVSVLSKQLKQDHANKAVTSPGTLVFWRQRSRRNSNESTPTRGASRVGVKSGDFRPISRYISETVQDRDILTMEG